MTKEEIQTQADELLKLVTVGTTWDGELELDFTEYIKELSKISGRTKEEILEELEKSFSQGIPEAEITFNGKIFGGSKK